jgi:arsenite methyltransferase
MSKRRCAELPWAEFELADAVKLPYNDSSFDAAVSTQVYEYVPDISAALKEVEKPRVGPGHRAIQ